MICGTQIVPTIDQKFPHVSIIVLLAPVISPSHYPYYLSCNFAILFLSLDLILSPILANVIWGAMQFSSCTLAPLSLPYAQLALVIPSQAGRWETSGKNRTAPADPQRTRRSSVLQGPDLKLARATKLPKSYRLMGDNKWFWFKATESEVVSCSTTVNRSIGLPFSSPGTRELKLIYMELLERKIRPKNKQKNNQYLKLACVSSSITEETAPIWKQ